jgi:uncharacterized protein YhaN
VTGQTTFERVHLDGFGRFCELELELRPGLNLLHGPNEAGKSTFLAFLKAVLFGFERRPAERHEPRSGGAFGGVMRLGTAAGSLQVRRTFKRRQLEGELTLTDASGSQLSEGALAQALGGVSRQLYAQVFAITLDELQDFKALSDESEVSEALFAAGMQGAARLPEIVQRLEADAAELYAERGQRPQLNVALKALEHLRLRLHEAARPPEAFFVDRARQQALLARDAELRELVPALRRRVQRLDQLERARVPLAALQRLPAEDPTLDDATPELEPRLATLEEQGRQARRALMPVEEQLAEAQAERFRLESTMASRGTVRSAQTALAAFRRLEPVAATLEARAQALEERKRQLELEIVRLVSRPLGVAWLQGLDAGAARLAELKGYRDRASGRSGHLERAQELARAAVLERERLANARAELESRLPTEVPSVEGVDAAIAAIEQLVSVGLATDHRLARLRDLEARAESELQEGAPVGSWLGGRALTAGLAALAVAVILAGALGGVRLAAPLGALALAAAAILVGAFLRLAQGARQRYAAWDERTRASAARRQARATERGQLEAELADLGHRQEQLGLEAGVREVAQAAPRRQVLARQRQLADQALQLRRELGRNEADLRAIDQRQQQAARSEAASLAELDDIQQRVDALLTGCGFPPGLSAQQGIDLLGEAARLQDAWISLASETVRHLGEAQEVDRANQAVLAEAASLGAGASDPRHAALAIQGLLDQQDLDREALQAARARVEALAGSRGQTVAERDELAAQGARLLASAGVADAEALRRRARLVREHRVSVARRRALEQEVEATTQGSVAAAASELEAIADLETERREVQARLESAELEVEAVRTEAGALQERLASLDGEPLAALRLEEAELASSIGRLASRHAQLAVARAVLQASRRRFEAAHQPRLVSRVTELFRELTQGRYPLVALDPGSRGACAVDDTGGRWRVAELSRGTRELLLLAFRLAVAEDFGETRVRLPLVLDDVLVDLDPQRAARAAEVLAQVATRHQVLVLTCHPHLRRLLEPFAAASIPLHEGKQLSLLSSRGE